MLAGTSLQRQNTSQFATIMRDNAQIKTGTVCHRHTFTHAINILGTKHFLIFKNTFLRSYNQNINLCVDMLWVRMKFMCNNKTNCPYTTVYYSNRLLQ